MIYEALNFLKTRIEKHVSGGMMVREPLIILSNPWSNNDNNRNFTFLNSISLINIEEEKIFKSQLPQVVHKPNGKYVTKEPDLKLNLYILISAYNKNYEDGLKFLSKIVSFFQVNNVFQRDPALLTANNDLPVEIEKLIVELYTPGFEQQNQIWASLSMGYIPSVIYKVRMIIIDNDTTEDEQLLIKEIQTII